MLEFMGASLDSFPVVCCMFKSRKLYVFDLSVSRQLMVRQLPGCIGAETFSTSSFDDFCTSSRRNLDETVT